MQIYNNCSTVLFIHSHHHPISSTSSNSFSYLPITTTTNLNPSLTTTSHHHQHTSNPPTMIFNNLFSRLSRPFTAAARLSIAPESSASTTSIPEGAQRCTVAAGCYWGTEHLYRKHFSGKGLIDAKVGFIGGDLTNPTYRAVCGGKTGRELLSGSLSLRCSCD